MRDCGDYCEWCKPELVYGPKVMLDAAKPRYRVTIRVSNGIGQNGVEYRERTGHAVMRGPAGWVLNMGGRHGTPAMATVGNLVREEAR